MKKSFQKPLMMLFSIILFTACKKTDLPTQPTEEATIEGASARRPSAVMTRVKTKTWQGIEVRTYTYDVNGRQLGSTSDVASTDLYQYIGTSTINFTNTSINGPILKKSVLELNNKGLVVKSTSSDKYELFTYNAKKQLATYEEHYTSGSITTRAYEYLNGNLVQITATYNGAPFYVQTFTYYIDKPNGLDNDVFGTSFFGVGSKNLVKSEAMTGQGIANTTDYSYEFDELSRVSKMKITFNGIAAPDFIYTYY